MWDCVLALLQSIKSEWVTALSSLVLMLVTGAYVWISWKIFAGRFDPYVIVTVTHDKDRPNVLMLIVKNIGPGLAENVKFQSDRLIPERAFGISPEDAEDAPAMENGPLVTGIPCLGPGETREITWGQYGGLTKALGNAPLEITCSFQRQGKKMPPVKCLLEVTSFEGTDASNTPQVEAVKHLRNIEKNIEKLAREVASNRAETKQLLAQFHASLNKI